MEQELFSLKFIVDKIIWKECLLYKTRLDRDLKRIDWHIPLCRKHRNEYLEQIGRKITLKKPPRSFKVE